MKKLIVVGALVLSPMLAHAEYRQVNLTVFGMDCAPCAHAIHVSMKGIKGVEKVEVDLNTGLVSLALAPGNVATLRQFNEAVEKNGFTHKDAKVVATGRLGGTAGAPTLEVAGTPDRFVLVPTGAAGDLAPLLGKTVTVVGVLPEAARGKVPNSLRYVSVAEAR